MILARQRVGLHHLGSQVALHQDGALHQVHLLRRVGENGDLGIIAGDHLWPHEVGRGTVITRQHLSADHSVVVSQDIVQAKTTVFLDSAHVVCHRHPLGLVRLCHQVADKDLARVALADSLVDLLDQQGRN